MYLRFIDGTIYESFDEGVTFIKLTSPDRLEDIEKAPSGIVAVTYYTYQSASYYFLIGSPNDGEHQYIWRSTDEGVTYQRLSGTPEHISSFQVNPINREKLLIVKYVSHVSSQLYLSEDFGDSWRLIMENNIYYARVSWSNSAEYPDRIYATGVFSLSGISVSYWNYKIIYSDDFFSTFETIEDRSPEWSLTSNGILANKRVNSSESQNFNLVYNTHANVFDFRSAQVEHDDVVFSQAILDRRLDSILTLGTYKNITSLFSTFNIHDPFVEIDSNVTNPIIKTISTTLGNYLKNVYSKELEHDLQYVSNDFGRHWTKVLPKEDLGEEFFVFIETNIARYLSIQDAKNPGVIVTRGYIADQIVSDVDLPDTLISNDAGLTWKKAWGPNISGTFLEGGILLLVTTTPSNTILFSVDDGISFLECKISDEDTTVYSITTPFTNESVAVIFSTLVKSEGDVSYTDNIMTTLNFTEVNFPECTDEDFELWSPHNDNCANGIKATYKRRNKQCIHRVEDTYGTEVQCPCSSNDYKCQYPYLYNATLDTCLYYEGVNNLMYLDRYDCEVTENIENAMELREGSRCEEIEDKPIIDGIRYSCKFRSSSEI